MSKKLFVLATAMLIIGFQLYAQTLDEIVNKSINARGGKGAIAEIKSLLINGKMSMMGMEAAFTMTFKQPSSYRMDIEIMGSKVVSVINSTGGWSINPMMGGDEPQKLSEEDYNKAKRQLNFIDHPFVDDKIKMELLGKETLESKECFKIKMIMEDSTESTMFISASDYLPYMLKMKVNQMGQEYEIENYFLDYKPIKSLKLPYKTETKANGQTQMTLNFEEVKIDATVDDSIFEMPKSK